jgi:hypothetical protein
MEAVMKGRNRWKPVEKWPRLYPNRIVATMDSAIVERRTKRSADREEALQFLVETVADRRGVPALVLIDEAGRIVAGTGMPREVVGLARAAREVARRRATPKTIDAATGGKDVSARTFATPDGMLTFAALSEQVTGLGEAVRAVKRILAV